MEKRKCVIVDPDGICFDPTERLDRCKDNAGDIDWEQAFSNAEVSRDPVIEGAPEATRKISEMGFHILFLTGRSYAGFQATLKALSINQFGGLTNNLPHHYGFLSFFNQADAGTTK